MNKFIRICLLLSLVVGFGGIKSVNAETDCELTIIKDILITDTIASVTFDMSEACDEQIISFVSYQIPEGAELYPQIRFAKSAGTFGPGERLLRIDVPECDYRVDLIKGDSFKTLERPDQYSNNLITTFDGPVCGENNESVCPLGRNAVIIEGDRGDGESFTVTGDTAVSSFKIAEGCTDIPVSLLAFQRTTEELLPQTLKDSASGNFSYDDGAVHTLSVEIPPCQMQADLLYGTFTGTTLDESNINEFSTRALDWITNLTVCEEVTPPPTTPPPPPNQPSSGGGGGGPAPEAPAVIIPPVVIQPPPPTPVVLGETLPPPELDLGGGEEVSTVPVGGVRAGKSIPGPMYFGLASIMLGVLGLYMMKRMDLSH